MGVLLLWSLPLALALLGGLSTCQDPDEEGCPLILASDLGSVGSPSTSGLVAESYTSGDNPTPPDIEIHQINLVCLSAGSRRDMWRGASVVVRYTCGAGGACNGTLLSQFEVTCISDQWRLNVLGSSSIPSLRTTPADASLDSPLRTDCSICVTPGLGPSLGLAVAIDPIAHCAGCTSGCNIGLMQCYGFVDDTCCNYYENDACTANCTSPRIVAASNTCLCPGSFLEPDCSVCGLQCDNGGTPNQDCTECMCSNGYNGSLCENDIDECAEGAPCQNGGTCINTFGSFTCACPRGFSGPFCDENIDDCTPNPCVNQGNCSDDVAGFTCSCPLNWGGDTCETCALANCRTCTSEVLLPSGAAYCRACNTGYEAVQGMCVCALPNCNMCSVDSPPKCGECDVDYTLVDGACEIVCEEFCKSCEKPKECTVCEDGFVLDQDKCVKGSSGIDASVIGIIIAAIIAALLLLILIIVICVIVFAVRKKRLTSRFKLTHTDADKFDGATVMQNPMYLSPDIMERDKVISDDQEITVNPGAVDSD